MDQKLALDLAAAYAKSTTAPNRAISAAWKAYAARLSSTPVEPPVESPIEPPPVVVPPVPVLSPGVHDDTAVIYSGNWTVGANSSLYQGNDHYTNTPGASATFKFTGTGFRLFAAKDFPHGIMGVSVDGGADVDVDLYSATRVDAKVYEVINIPQGTYTVVLKHTNRKNAASQGTFVLLDKVEVLTGTVDPPIDGEEVPPVPPVPTPGAIPPISLCGPKGGLAPNSAVHLNGTYNNQKFGEVLSIAPGSVLNNCELAWYKLAPSPNVQFHHCKMHGGAWHDNSSHDGWIITWSIIDGGTRQCMRPNGPGTIRIEDSWLLTHDTELNPDIHTESIQHLGQVTGIYTRVAFSCQPRWASWGTPITGVVSVDGPGVLTDCVMGYWNGIEWSAGGGFFAVYPGVSTKWIRPIIYHDGSGYWYTPHTPGPDRLTNPIYR